MHAQTVVPGGVRVRVPVLVSIAGGETVKEAVRAALVRSREQDSGRRVLLVAQVGGEELHISLVVMGLSGKMGYFFGYLPGDFKALPAVDNAQWHDSYFEVEDCHWSTGRAFMTVPQKYADLTALVAQLKAGAALEGVVLVS